ncbi:MAG: hypothetical protein AAF696_02240 [Bacteroidota bacterium]
MDKQYLHNLLHRSLHEDLTEEEKKVLQEGLEEQKGLREEKVSLLALQKLLAGQDFRFKPFFSSRVMHEIDVTRQPKGLFSSINYAFMRISLPTMVAIFIWILAFWGAEGSLSVDGILGIAEVSYEEIVNEFLVNN